MRKRRVEKMLQNMTTEENVALTAYFDKGRWNNLDPDKRKEYESLLVSALTRDPDAE
jgi:hypothetical protein